MIEDRPADWDWVKAVDTCKATVMFGTLKTLAKQNVDTRNAQVGKNRFVFQEIDGITFSVLKPNERDRFADQVFFKVTDDLLSITVSRPNGGRQPELLARYEVGLSDTSECKLRSHGIDYDPWQVLKANLEELLFG